MKSMILFGLLGVGALALLAGASTWADTQPLSAEQPTTPPTVESSSPSDSPQNDTEAVKESNNARTAAIIFSLTVFVLAIFLGFEIITKVPPTLHTPLMSGSNAISGITLVGALLVTGASATGAARIWGFFAVLLATINVVGGFLVTHRMLAMFSKPRR